MEKEKNIIVGISIGDLNGIGGEIILKTFENPKLLQLCTPVIFASIESMMLIKAHFDSKVNFNAIKNINDLIYKKINVVNVWNEIATISFGENDPKAGEYSIKSLQAATNALQNNLVDVLVTAPINKHNIQSKTFKFPGHTDYLNQKLEGNSLMFMVTPSLKIALLTDHIPLKDVASLINPSLIKEKVATIYASLQKDFKIQKPKIAVLGINPHTGDNGVIGTEDDTIIKPTLNEINTVNEIVYGPFAADSFFGSNNFKNFDAIIAPYHDQGLIPFKTLTFGEGVNYTAGLSKIRTSPDHGTAYEIAGKGIANNNSFNKAVLTAIQIFKNRANHLNSL